MPDTTVKYFNSTMNGAPALSGTAGTLIGVLDACLVNGFGSVTLDSLVVASNVATGTVSAGHNLAMVGATGPVVTIAGATPSGLNGEWRIASVPGSTTFTFATTGISDQAATGTITAKRAPAGWEKRYSGTNKAAYARLAPQATGMMLRVDDAGTTHARLRGYETMTDVDTGTGLFPTDAQVNGGLYTVKSGTANSTSRGWILIADAQLAFWYTQPSDSLYVAGNLFGDFESRVAADGYKTLIQGSYNSVVDAGYNVHQWIVHTTLDGHYLPRTYTQLGGSVKFGKVAFCYPGQVYSGVGGLPYPNPADNRLLLSPCLIADNNAVRGTLPGFWSCLNTLPESHRALVNSLFADNRTGVLIATSHAALQAGSVGRILIDITGPWR